MIKRQGKGKETPRLSTAIVWEVPESRYQEQLSAQ
jgi:hypothetical protein